MDATHNPLHGSPLSQVEATPIAHMTSSTRAVVRQACDECRARKRRCELFEDGQVEASRLQWPLVNQGLAEAEGRCCRSCARLGVACTFLVPAKTRGRKRKRRENSVSSAFSALSARTASQYSGALPVGASLAESGNAKGDRTSPLSYSPCSLTPAESLVANGSSVDNGAATIGPRNRTDELCSRELLLQIMDDYLEHIYPILPIVHRPTFRAGLARSRDVSDPEFSALIVCLAAATVGLLPERFHAYRAPARPDGLRFRSRSDMINECFGINQRARGPDYFDRINLRKWACSYLISIAFFQIGQRNRSRMAEVEAIQLARMLGLHRIDEYKDLNCIEAQLRKKAFWIMFYGYVHLELQNLRRDVIPFLDPSMLRLIKLEDLLPMDVDDEMILEHTILSAPSLSATSACRADASPSLTSTFILHSRVFWAALRGGASLLPFSRDFCECGKGPTKSPLHLVYWRERLYELKYMLDDAPGPLRQWNRPSPPNSRQHEIMRANLHVTNLWLQCLIMDKIEYALQACSDNSTSSSVLVDATIEEMRPGNECLSGVQRRWAERDFICCQLLHVLHSLTYEYLEPNGLYLVPPPSNPTPTPSSSSYTERATYRRIKFATSLFHF